MGKFKLNIFKGGQKMIKNWIAPLIMLMVIVYLFILLNQEKKARRNDQELIDDITEGLLKEQEQKKELLIKEKEIHQAKYDSLQTKLKNEIAAHEKDKMFYRNRIEKNKSIVSIAGNDAVADSILRAAGVRK